MKEKKKESCLKLGLEKEAASPWALAVLALVVVFQALVLVMPPKTSVEPPPPFSPPSEEVAGAAAGLVFVPSGVSLKQKEQTNLDLYLVPKRPLKLDGVDIVLAFDPEVLQVTQVTTPKLFSFVSQKKEKEREGKVSLTFLEEKTDGLWLKEKTKLLTLTIEGKAAGRTDLAVVVGDEGASTVVVENMTSKKLLFDYRGVAVEVD